jgi:hypothetical protein
MLAVANYRANWGAEETAMKIRPQSVAASAKPVKRRQAVASPPPLVVNFNGDVTMLSDSPILKRYNLAIGFQFIFSADRKEVEISPIAIKAGPIQITSDTNYGGKVLFDVSTGELKLPARFNVTGPSVTGNFSLTFPPPPSASPPWLGRTRGVSNPKAGNWIVQPARSLLPEP